MYLLIFQFKNLGTFAQDTIKSDEKGFDIFSRSFSLLCYFSPDEN